MDRQLLRANTALARLEVLRAMRKQLRGSRRSPWEGMSYVEFSEKVLGIMLWEKVAEVFDSVQNNRYTLVTAGHATGKTHGAADLIIAFMNVHYSSQALSTAPTGWHVEKRLWAEINKQYQLSRRSLPGKMFKTRYELGPKRFATGISTNESANFQGGHEEHLLIVFDEGQGVRPEIWTAAYGMMTNPGARFLVICNPTETSGDVYDASLSPEWNVIVLDCEEHPNVIAAKNGEPEPFPGAVSLEWVLEREREWGRDSPLFQSRVKGIFPTISDNVVITRPMIQECVDAIPPRDDGTFMGVDVARYGEDFSSVCITRNGVPIYFEKWQGMSTTTTAGKVRQLMTAFEVEPHRVNVDVTGVGAGVVDSLAEAGVYVNGVVMAEKPNGCWDHIFASIRCLNKRAELWWAARCLILRHEVSIDPKFKEIWADLTVPHYKFSTSDKLVIESKEDIRKRIGRSTDGGDAYILTLAREAECGANISFL